MLSEMKARGQELSGLDRWLVLFTYLFSCMVSISSINVVVNCSRFFSVMYF